MHQLLKTILLPLAAVMLPIFCSTPKNNRVEIDTPENLYGKLFTDIQLNSDVFGDSKTFPDCIPNHSPEQIRKEYARLNDHSTSTLKRFIDHHFTTPGSGTPFTGDSLPIDDHITRLWVFLERSPDTPVSGTRIPLPHPYIVPGGRFREIYYWDSYFTMLGLREDSLTGTIRNMVDNFSHLIDSYGFIPNGNRTYYRTRSQPPFFACMVGVLATCSGDSIFIRYRDQMEKEYRFWMNGEEKLAAGTKEIKRVVLLENGTVLNRYWDNATTPRAESYREDVATASAAVRHDPARTRTDVYRNLRAAAESGWDFSSRWLTPDSAGTFHLYTIHTTDIIPVDLNALLCNLERTLSRSYSLAGDTVKAAWYDARYQRRRAAIDRYCWNDSIGFYGDYNFRKKSSTGVLALAGAYPLFFELVNRDKAKRIAATLRRYFLQPGGVVTTLYNTGQQWDMPNGWAPLQWIVVKGLRSYDHTGLADTIAGRWCSLNRKVYNSTFKMMEKYNVVDTSKESGGGEYPTQDGFGWTNGVYKVLCSN